MSTASRTYRIPEGVLYQELDRESVLLNMRTEQYYALDPVGTRIWKLLEETGRVENAVQAMLAEYDTAEAALQRDVEDLVQKLLAKGLLIEESRMAAGEDA